MKPSYNWVVHWWATLLLSTCVLPAALAYSSCLEGHGHRGSSSGKYHGVGYGRYETTTPTGSAHSSFSRSSYSSHYQRQVTPGFREEEHEHEHEHEHQPEHQHEHEHDRGQEVEDVGLEGGRKSISEQMIFCMDARYFEHIDKSAKDTLLEFLTEPISGYGPVTLTTASNLAMRSADHSGEDENIHTSNIVVHPRSEDSSGEHSHDHSHEHSHEPPQTVAMRSEESEHHSAETPHAAPTDMVYRAEEPHQEEGELGEHDKISSELDDLYKSLLKKVYTFRRSSLELLKRLKPTP